MDNLSVIDRDELLDRIDADIELLQELVELFLEDYPEQISEIESAIKSQDAIKLRASAHTLKGSVGNFCAPGAFEAAKKLEVSGANNDFSTTEADFSELVSEIKRVDEALQKLAGDYA